MIDYKAEYEKLTKSCSVCGGSGECLDCNGEGSLGVCKDGRDQSCETCGGHEDSLGTGKCPTCNGTGRVTRYIVPDWFIEKLKRNHMKVVNGNLVFTVTGCPYDGYDVCVANLTRLTDSMWELKEVKE